MHEESGRLVYQDEDGLLDLPRPRLIGRHQYVNAGTAIAALRAAGFGSSTTSAFEAGCPAPNGRDACSGSRRAACRLLPQAPTLARRRPQPRWRPGACRRHGRFRGAQCAPLVLIVGMLGTKDSAGFLRTSPASRGRCIAVPIRPDGRAAGREVAAIAADVRPPTSSVPSVEARLPRYEPCLGPAPRILICGSLYLAGEVLAANGTLPH